MARGGIWVFSLRIIERVFYFLRLIILARILAPSDFGLLGISLLTMMTLENFSKTGFETALIQRKEVENKYLNSTWTVGIIRSVFLFLALYLIAPYIADFFGTAQAKPIIRVLGVSFLINAFTNVGIIFFKKDLKFNKQFIYQLSGTLADFIFTVSAALLFRSVWALVFGLIAGNFARLITSYIVHPYRPRLNLDLEIVKELFGFGRWVLGSSLLVFLITQGDDFLVGKLLGVTVLGFYQMAYRISNAPATEISHVISQVAFPAFSKLQDNLSNLKNTFLKVLQLTAFLSFPLAGLIFVLSSDFTRIFLGEKWMPIVPAMQVLVLAGLARSVATSSGFLFYAIGMPNKDTQLQAVRLAVLLIFIYPFTVKWGIVGASMAVLLSIFISCIGFSYMAIKITNCGVAIYSKMLIIPLFNGIISALFIFKLKSTMEIRVFEFALLICVGLLIYSAMIYISDKLFNYKMQSVLKEGLQLIRGG